MSSNFNEIKFNSQIAQLIKQFIQEKRACGYKYNEAVDILKNFDNYLCSAQLKKTELSKEIILQWAQKQSGESASSNQRRISFTRELARFMLRMGYQAYVVPKCFGPMKPHNFSPYIFTKKEIRKLIQAADKIKPSAHSPLRHLIIPEIIRLLYGCGFRIGEVLNLRISDVDLKQGVITVRGAKFNKDRLVPPAVDMVERLKIYAQRLEKESLEKRNNESFFFTSRKGKALRNSTIFSNFRKLLFQCGIHCGGRSKGPRIHDLRYPNLKKIQTFFKST
jgi:integrase/recombinase XerD